MTEFLSTQFAPTFAGDILMRLGPPVKFEKRRTVGKLLGVPGVSVWVVTGSLPLKAHKENGNTNCLIVVQVRPDWLSSPPVVTIHEPFIKPNRDWHVNEGGDLCYILKDEWRDRLAELFAKSDGNISFVIDFAVTWLLAAVDSLATRHLHATRYGIEKWPSDWAAYAHGEDGEKEYLRERRKKGGPKL